MRWKASLTPLDQVTGLDDSIKQKLLANHINTAEELVGQIEAARGELGETLGIDESAVTQLRSTALNAIGPEFKAAMAEQRDVDRPLGALPPDELP